MNRLLQSLTSQTLTFTSGQRIAYNNATEELTVVDRNSPLESRCTIDLALITSKISNVIHARDRLNVEQTQLLQYNITQLNSSFTRYNEKIGRNYFLNLIDRIIFFFSCHQFTLRYAPLPAPALPVAPVALRNGNLSVQYATYLLDNAQKGNPAQLTLTNQELIACALPHFNDLSQQNRNYIMDRLLELDNNVANWTDLLRICSPQDLFKLYIYINNHPAQALYPIVQRKLFIHLINDFIPTYLMNSTQYEKIRLFELLLKEYQKPDQKDYFVYKQIAPLFALIDEIKKEQREQFFEMVNSLKDLHWANFTRNNSKKLVELYRSLLSERVAPNANILLNKLFSLLLEKPVPNAQVNTPFQQEALPFFFDIIATEYADPNHRKEILKSQHILSILLEKLPEADEGNKKLIFEILNQVAGSDETLNPFIQSANSDKLVQLYLLILNNNHPLQSGPLHKALFNLFELLEGSRDQNISFYEKLLPHINEIIFKEYANPNHKDKLLQSDRLVIKIVNTFNSCSDKEKKEFIKILNEVALDDNRWNHLKAIMPFNEKLFNIHFFILTDATEYRLSAIHRKLFSNLAGVFHQTELYYHLILIEAQSSFRNSLFENQLDSIASAFKYFTRHSYSESENSRLVCTLLNGLPEDLWQKLAEKIGETRLANLYCKLKLPVILTYKNLHERLISFFLKNHSKLSLSIWHEIIWEEVQSKSIVLTELFESKENILIIADICLKLIKELYDTDSFLQKYPLVQKTMFKPLLIKRILKPLLIFGLENDTYFQKFKEYSEAIREPIIDLELKIILYGMPLDLRVSILNKIANRNAVDLLTSFAYNFLREDLSKMNTKEISERIEEINALFALMIRLDLFTEIPNTSLLSNFMLYLGKPSARIYLQRVGFSNEHMLNLLKKVFSFIEKFPETHAIEKQDKMFHPLRILEILYNFNDFIPTKKESLNEYLEIISVSLPSHLQRFVDYLTKYDLFTKPLQLAFFLRTSYFLPELDLEEQDRFFHLMIHLNQVEAVFNSPACQESRCDLFTYKDSLNKLHTLSYRNYTLLSYFEYSSRVTTKSPELFDNLLKIFSVVRIKEYMTKICAFPLLKFLANFESICKERFAEVLSSKIEPNQVLEMFNCLVELPSFKLGNMDLSLTATYVCSAVRKLKGEEWANSSEELKKILAKVDKSLLPQVPK